MPVSRAWGFVERLFDEPWSRYRAKLIGGPDWRQHLGWGPPEYQMAALIDAVQINTVVTAAHGSGKRPKTPEPFPRPKFVDSEEPTESEPAGFEISDIDEVNRLLNQR